MYSEYEFVTAYKSYRLYITKSSSGSNGYAAVSEWKLFEDEEGTGANLLTGGVASANSVYSSYPANNAFDGDENTTWESTSSNGVKWLRYDLPEPVVARSMYLSHNNWSGERPAEFELQGSNDNGATWDFIAKFDSFLTTSLASRKASIVRNVKGKSVTADGQANTRVLIYEWGSGQLIASLSPDNDGMWSIFLTTTNPILVVHIPPTGYRPMADGPIYVSPRW